MLQVEKDMPRDRWIWRRGQGFAGYQRPLERRAAGGSGGLCLEFAAPCSEGIDTSWVWGRV